MCVRILNTDTQTETDNPLEFAYMLNLPVKDLPVENTYGKLIPDNCLCQVDIEKACKLAGYNYREVNRGYIEIEVSKKTKQEVIEGILNYKNNL
jgi:hypothetical protein